MSKTTYSPVTQTIVKDLTELLGPRNVSVDPDKILVYSRDEVQGAFWKGECLAEVVVFPENTEQVSALARFATKNNIPLTPRGAGTGLSGGAVPAYRGILVSMEKMNRILEIDTVNFTITVEPGVVTSEINKCAKDAGLMYAGDPCSGDASFIGGNIAENAGGNKVIKYGPTGNHVLALEVVLPDGTVTWFGGKRRKDVTGYDFIHLMVGSEGTLAIITKAILNLVPLPAYTADLLVPFKTIAEAMDFVPRIMTEARLVPSSIEFMDSPSVKMTERFLNMKIPYSNQANAYLIIELEGNNYDTLADQYEAVGDLCLDHGALEVFVADNRNMSDKLWKARKSVAEAVWALYPGETLNEDIVVPTGEIPKLMKELERICNTYGAGYASYGHAGDGNMHVTVYFENTFDGYEKELLRIQNEIYETTRRLGGTLTGEHGVGLKRRDHISFFLDESQIELIRRVKLAFDPKNILNPGKIVTWQMRQDIRDTLKTQTERDERP